MPIAASQTAWFQLQTWAKGGWGGEAGQSRKPSWREGQGGTYAGSRKGEGGYFLVASGRGVAATQVSVQDKSARQEAGGGTRAMRASAEGSGSRRGKQAELGSKWQLPDPTNSGRAQAGLAEACRETRSHSLLLFTKPGAPEPPPGPEAAFP